MTMKITDTTRGPVVTTGEALPSIARSLAALASRALKAADLLSRAAVESAEGRNDAREDLIREAREELRAVLADENFAPEVSQ